MKTLNLSGRRKAKTEIIAIMVFVLIISDISSAVWIDLLCGINNSTYVHNGCLIKDEDVSLSITADFYAIQSPAGSVSPFTIGFYLSKDENIDPSDYLIGELRVSDLTSDGDWNFEYRTWNGVVHANVPVGHYYIGHIVDLYNEIAEFDENNNICPNPDRYIGVYNRVPNVVGMTQAQADSAIHSAYLYVGTISFECSDTVSKGKVISQDPKAGESPCLFYCTVDYIVSLGPCEEEVPNVVGMTQTAASSVVSDAGLSPAFTFIFDPAPNGQVISQDPEAGTIIPSGSTVVLTISLGPSGGPGAVRNIIWVSDAHQTLTGSTTPDDQGWVDLLRSEGYNVDYQPPTAPATGYWRTLDAAKLAALDAADLIIISRDTSSTNYANDATEVTQWNSIKTPIILLQVFLTQSSRWSWLNSISTGQRQAYFTAKAVDPLHPIFDGVNLDSQDRVTWLDQYIVPGYSSYINTTDAGNGLIIAVRPDNNYIVIAEWAAGIPFYAGSTQTPGGKRMLFCAGTEQTPDTGVGWGVYDLTMEGEKMFLNAVAYMIGEAASYTEIVIGDFEQSMEGWGPTPADLLGGPAPTLSYSTTGVTSGNNSLAIKPNKNGFQWSFMYSGIVDLQTYKKLSVDVTWVAAEWGSTPWCNFKEVVVNSDGPSGWKQYIPSDTVDPDWPGSWDPVNWGNHTRTLTWDFSDYDATGATWMQIIFSTNFGGSTPGKYYIDNVHLIGEEYEPETAGGLVGWWKLDETSGTTAYDSAGENDGILYGNPIWQPTSGKINGTLRFDGSNDYVSLPIGSLISSLSDCTISTWANWSGTGGDWQRVFDFGSGQQINMFITPRNGTTGQMRFAITTGGGGAEDQATATMALLTGWHHVAVTIDAANKKYILYLDGAVVAQKTATRYTPSSLGNTTQNWLGRSQYPADPYFNGSLDDFRIYDRVLGINEITQLWADGLVGN
jgi:hypothetical protein